MAEERHTRDELFSDDAGAEEDFAGVPDGELAGSDAALGLVEEDIQAARTEEERRALQRLPVPDPHPTAEQPFASVYFRRLLVQNRLRFAPAPYGGYASSSPSYVAEGGHGFFTNTFFHKLRRKPMDFVRGNAEGAAGEARVGVAFADVDAAGGGVGGDDEDGLRMAADIQALALADGVELRAVMLTGYDAVRI